MLLPLQRLLLRQKCKNGLVNRNALSFLGTCAKRDIEQVDVVVVGAGPAGLTTAIRLKQLALQRKREVRVMVMEKGAEVGAHVISGNVFEPRALQELFPNSTIISSNNTLQQNEEKMAKKKKDKEVDLDLEWVTGPPPLHTAVVRDEFRLLLSENASVGLPHPPALCNKGNFVISLSLFTRWLAAEAEARGVEIYPGFPASTLLYDKTGKVYGVQANDIGISKLGEKTDRYVPGIEVHAKHTVLAEGCHGSLSKQAINKFKLRAEGQFQTYGIGLKEIWEVPKDQHTPGLVVHTVGWPTASDTYQGGFLYHWSDSDVSAGRCLVSVGMVVGLDYSNPFVRPYMEFQRYKHHKVIRQHLEKGRCISYGARALNEGGWQSIPKLTFPGGLLVGCAAGFLNVPKIKGTHTAMKSGLLAAQHIFNTLTTEEEDSKPVAAAAFDEMVRDSWVGEELRAARNVRPGFSRGGLWIGLLNAGFETFVARGRAPWTLTHHAPDHTCLKPADACARIEYRKPDGKLSFDLLDNLARSGTGHEANQPAHLKVTKPEAHVERNLAVFAGPEQRFCPAGVYEYLDDTTTTTTTKKGGGVRFQVNAQNCLHCKTCDIKDPSQSISWTTPEGGGGPAYTIM